MPRSQRYVPAGTYRFYQVPSDSMPVGTQVPFPSSSIRFQQIPAMTCRAATRGLRGGCAGGCARSHDVGIRILVAKPGRDPAALWRWQGLSLIPIHRSLQ